MIDKNKLSTFVKDIFLNKNYRSFGTTKVNVTFFEIQKLSKNKIRYNMACKK